MKYIFNNIMLFFVFFYMLSAGEAFAYIDPGIGSILLQSLIAIFASISSFCLFYWKKIKNFFKKKDKK